MEKSVLDIENYLAHQIMCCYRKEKFSVPFFEHILNPYVNNISHRMIKLRSYHMLDFNDFIEYATSDLVDKPDYSYFDNNHIYFYQALHGTYDQGIFESAHGYDFSIVGVAIAKKDNEYTVFAQIRYITEYINLHLDVLENNEYKKYFNIAHRFPYEFFTLSFIEESNIKELAEKLRCIITPPIMIGKDAEYGLRIKISDDSLLEYYKEEFGEDSPLLKPESLNIVGQGIDKHQTEYEIVRLLFYLPSYFDFMYDLVIDEKKKIGVKNNIKSNKIKSKKNSKGKPIYKIVKSLKVTYNAEEETRNKFKEKKRTWTAPSYKFAVRGHWRMLQYSWSKGHDAQGNEILGKTWISDYEKGKGKNELVFEGVYKDPEVIINLKQTLSYARDIIKSHKLGKMDEKQDKKRLKTLNKNDKNKDLMIVSNIQTDKPSEDWIYQERIKLSAGLRFLILKRDNYRCVLCGRGTEDGVKLEIDHIEPISNWGRTTESNLRTLCRPCNQGKGFKY